MRRYCCAALLSVAFALLPAQKTEAQDLFEARRLTTDPAQEGFPTWSPDGDSIIYQYTEMNDTIGKNGLWKV